MSTMEKSPSPGPSDEERNVSPAKATALDDASSVGGLDSFEGYVIDKDMEKKMLRKFDISILPTLALMYLFKYVQSTSRLHIAFIDMLLVP